MNTGVAALADAQTTERILQFLQEIGLVVREALLPGDCFLAILIHDQARHILQMLAQLRRMPRNIGDLRNFNQRSHALRPACELVDPGELAQVHLAGKLI